MLYDIPASLFLWTMICFRRASIIEDSLYRAAALFSEQVPSLHPVLFGLIESIGLTY